MKVGIIGAGGIARKVAEALTKSPAVECRAIASRDPERAREYAETFGFQRAYGDYEALVEDPEVELVYVATPHSHHYEHMMLALSHGKPVLCEKAFTMNAGEARKIRDYAREKKLFAAEALWTRYMPSRQIIDDVIARGLIGTPHTLTANLSYPTTHKPRIVDPALCGGALLDVGVYGLNFALMHLGDRITRMESSVQMTDRGVDGMESITLFYEGGAMAVLTHSIYDRSDRKGILHGDRGYMVVENINNPQSVSVFDTDDKLVEFIPMPPQINGYEYEFEECDRMLREGRLESESMPLDESVKLMERMDALRRQWGLVYPRERT